MRNLVNKKMKDENISVSELCLLLNISRQTYYTFMEGKKVSERVIDKFEKYLNDKVSGKVPESMINIGQVRIPQSHYDYLKRHAEESDISVAEVLRRVIENVVDNDYLWKSFEEQLNITERALKTTMSNTMIPFIKQQDKEIAFVGNQVMYIEELLLRLFDKNNKDYREQLVPVKERMFEIGDDRRYKRKKHTD